MRDKDSTLAQFDQAGAQRLENIYLTPDVVQQLEQIFQLLHVKPGMRALDIGCGPGLTSLALSQAVGEQGRVDAIDIAPPMLHWPHRSMNVADLDAAFTELARVMQGWSQHIAHPQLPRSLVQRLLRAGFAKVQVNTIPLINLSFSPDTFSGGMMGFIASFVGGLPDYGTQLVSDWQADVSSMEEASGYFFSLNRYVFKAFKP